MPTQLPILYVEGADDVGIVNGLLFRHGIDTKGGDEHLHIEAVGNDVLLLAAMPEAVKANIHKPVGFVVDIDTKCEDRWDAIKTRLRQAQVETPISPPDKCPQSGYIDKVSDYESKFGVWLMPDCAQADGKIEDLVETLVRDGDPLWDYSLTVTKEAARLVDAANEAIDDSARKWKRFRDIDEKKARIRAWLAWQNCPGATMGAAIRCSILQHESTRAIAFMKWLGNLYGFPQLLGEQANQSVA